MHCGDDGDLLALGVRRLRDGDEVVGARVVLFGRRVKCFAGAILPLRGVLTLLGLLHFKKR